MHKTISVIMSTKDTDEKMLRQSIESILNQTYSYFEFIIICDGGEKDLDIVKSYSDDRIIIINHEKSLGLPKSLNEGICLAKGDYIARMDSDDISLKDRLEIQLEFMEKNKNIDICSTTVRNFGANEKYNTCFYYDNEGIKAQLFLYNCIAHPPIIIRKKFLDENDIFYDENFRYSQDYELWTRCMNLANFHIIKKTCLMYRIHSKQISTAKVDEQNKLCAKIYERLLDELKIECTEKNISYLFYLSGRGTTSYDYREIEEFIDMIILKNRHSKVYDENKLKRVLYTNLALNHIRKNRKVSSLHLLIKHNALGLLLKKILLNAYCKFSWILRKNKIPFRGKLI